MKIAAIGSVAFIAHGRPAQDLDLVVHERDRAKFEATHGRAVQSGDYKSQYTRGNVKIEVEWAYTKTSAEMILDAADKPKRAFGIDIHTATLDDLAACAVSACSIGIRTEKHRTTIKALKDAGVHPNEPLLNVRLFEAALRTKYNPARYFRSNAEFFKDSVKRNIAHDELHQMFMLGSVPCYLDMKKDMESAHVDIDVFNRLSFERRCECIWEEALVLGWEHEASATVSRD